MDAALSPPQVLTHALLILAGGIYLYCSELTAHALRPYRISQRTREILREVATYLAIKTDFYDASTDLDKNYKRLVDQQITVHEKQEAVRELLFKTRQIVEETTAEGRRLVFAFTEGVDFFEDITATYYDYALLRKQFAGTGALELVNKTLKKATAELDAIGIAIQSNANFRPSFDYAQELNDIKKKIDDIIPKGEANALILRKILVNIRKLFTDLNNISQYFQKNTRYKEQDWIPPFCLASIP
jgi:uncharacterized membrane protein YccC